MSFSSIPVICIGGCAGIGLVWGWLMADLVGPIHRPRRTALAIGLATLAISAQVVWIVDGQGLLFFLGPALLAFFIHFRWRRHLRNRCG